MTISSGDDGFHSDGPLTISGGTVQIDSSYEGIEGLQITISGGTIALKASDDGLNAAGGSDENGNFSRDHFFDQGNSECWIRITGGNLEVDAGGDGIDSNGGLYMDGGDRLCQWSNFQRGWGIGLWLRSGDHWRYNFSPWEAMEWPLDLGILPASIPF